MEGPGRRGTGADVRRRRDVAGDVRALVERGIERGLHVGGQVYASLHGEPIVDVGVGAATPDAPMEPTSLVPWHCLTKPVTAMAFAQLVDAGLVDVDQPVASVVPAFGANGKGAVTFRHLLTHTAGFRGDPAGPVFMRPWEEAVATALDAELCADPGTVARYSMFSGWFALGEAIRAVSGLPLDVYLRTRLLEPLGLDESWVGMAPADYERVGHRVAAVYAAAAFAPTGSAICMDRDACSLCIPGWGALGPMRELGRFYEALLEGRGVDDGFPGVRAATVRRFTGPQRQDLFDDQYNARVAWGLGFACDRRLLGGRMVSNEVFGHDGRGSSIAFADPAFGLVVAAFFNGMQVGPHGLLRSRNLVSTVFRALGRQTQA